MSSPSTLDGRERASGRGRWWVAAGALAFCGYYALVVTSDLTRPEPLGFVATFTGPAMHVRSVDPGSPAARAGLRPGDRIARAGGRELRHRLDWTMVAVNLRVGQPLPLEIVRNDIAADLMLTIARAGAGYWTTGAGATLLSARTVQFVALVLAIVVAFRRPDDRGARIGAWLLASMAVYSLDWPYQLASYWRALPLPAAVVLWIPFASSLVVPAILFTFFASFPRPVIRARWIAAAWAPMLALAAVEIAFAVRAIHTPAAERLALDWTTLHGAVNSAYTLGALALLLAGYRRLTGVTERRRVRMLVLGSMVGLLSLVLVASHWSRPDATVGDSLFNSPLAAVATLLGLALPVSFAYAILRHRLFNVGFLIRAGLQHALARDVLVSIAPAALAVFLADSWVHRAAPFGEVLQARGWGYLALAAVAVVARLRRDRWLEALDRRFFRERYNVEQLLRSIGEDVRTAPSFDRVASSTVARLESALHPKTAAILVRAAGGGAYRVVASVPAAARIDPLPEDSRLAGLLQWLQAPLRVEAAGQARLLRQLPAEDVAWLRRTRADLIIPVEGGGGSTDALLVLGPKRSQEPYSGADEDLLVAIAHSLAMLPAAVGPREVFGECPQCGTCEDAAVRSCAADGTTLAAQPGSRLLAGRYRLDRRIGRGGMGTVYDAYDTALDRHVALKLLRDDVVDALGGSAERFTAEARLAASLVHPNVVTIHDIGVTGNGRTFFVMERLRGATLRDELRCAGRLPPDRARHLLAGICAAVDAAHRRNIIHRDLKPENIMVVRDEGGETVKVLDFGLAKPLDAADGAVVTRPGIVGGTPEYMSPEHLRGGDPSPDWDLWALGVMAWEMLAGVLPAFDRAGRLASAASLPAPLGQLFTRVLSPRPIERPESARELLEAVEAAMDACHEIRT